MIISYVIIIAMNVIGFFTMGSDKDSAIHHEWRTSEKAIFIIAILGGSLGVLAGIYFFHHKTKKGCFTLGIPIILVVQIIVYHFFLRSFTSFLIIFAIQIILAALFSYFISKLKDKRE